MPRALFEKAGNARYISHLDLMRVFQRAFKRAGLPLTHTQGFNPRPSVSIALPLSLGVESRCELLDFELEHPCACDEICGRLNAALIDGVHDIEIENICVEEDYFLDFANEEMVYYILNEKSTNLYTLEDIKNMINEYLKDLKSREHVSLINNLMSYYKK